MNYGKAITISFILFGAFIAVLASLCMRETVDLVSGDYYQQELQHGEKMTAAANAAALPSAPAILFHGSDVTIHWDQLPRVESAELWLLRPSDPRLDRTFRWDGPWDGASRGFQIDGPQPGLYRARFAWTMDGREYLVEKVLIR